MTSERKSDFALPLQSQRPQATQHETLVVFRRHMSVERGRGPIFFPQGEDVRSIPTSSDIERDHPFFLARSLTQLSERRFSCVRVFRSKGEMDGLNEHITSAEVYFAADSAASMITAATRSGIESMGT